MVSFKLVWKKIPPAKIHAELDNGEHPDKLFRATPHEKIALYIYEEEGEWSGEARILLNRSWHIFTLRGPYRPSAKVAVAELVTLFNKRMRDQWIRFAKLEKTNPRLLERMDIDPIFMDVIQVSSPGTTF